MIKNVTAVVKLVKVIDEGVDVTESLDDISSGLPLSDATSTGTLRMRGRTRDGEV